MATYILDTNVISDILRQKPVVISHFEQAKLANARFILCEPVNFEVMRGLKYKKATQQIFVYQNQIRPLFQSLPIIQEDWEQAENLWVSSIEKGKQLSDIDLLLIVMTIKLDAILVSADKDFSIFSLNIENWRL